MGIRAWIVSVLVVVACSPLVTRTAVHAAQAHKGAPGPDVFYVPTPPEVVDAMLALAHVTSKDVVYDLGCGDGRIPIAAAQRYGARAFGIDIDPDLVKQANDHVRRAHLSSKVQIVAGDLFQTDLKQATVVTLYLLPWINEKLMPRLQKELRPGSRVVSHEFDMGDQWPPEKTLEVSGEKIYLWTIK